MDWQGLIFSFNSVYMTAIQFCFEKIAFQFRDLLTGRIIVKEKIKLFYFHFCSPLPPPLSSSHSPLYHFVSIPSQPSPCSTAGMSLPSRHFSLFLFYSFFFQLLFFLFFIFCLSFSIFRSCILDGNTHFAFEVCFAYVSICFSLEKCFKPSYP